MILLSFEKEKAANLFPDSSRIPYWFSDVTKVKLEDLGTQYKITDFGAIVDSTILQTEVIQKAIDRASNNGGVIIIPKGTFLSGALFFKPNTHLYLSQVSVLKGSDSISIYLLYWITVLIWWFFK